MLVRALSLRGSSTRFKATMCVVGVALPHDEPLDPPHTSRPSSRRRNHTQKGEDPPLFPPSPVHQAQAASSFWFYLEALALEQHAAAVVHDHVIAFLRGAG